MPVTREQLTTNLFLLEELGDVSRTRELAESDLDALRTVAAWIKAFIARPHDGLGRAGPVCPFVPGAVERKTLWLAPEHMAGRSLADVIEPINGYQRFLDAQSTDKDDVNYKAIVVVFTDLPLDRAGEFLDDVLEHLAVPSYVRDGFALGGSYEGNEAPAIHNPSFRPFTSPVPFLLVRQGVVDDWKFFLDSDDWLNLWARRYGDS
jgi:hypothetical protein